MLKMDRSIIGSMLIAAILGCACGPTEAAVRIDGQVQAGGGPLANSTVTLWAASTSKPKQLAQARTDSDGRFQLGSQETLGTDVILYVVAKGGSAVNKGSGDNQAIALLSVLGTPFARRGRAAPCRQTRSVSASAQERQRTRAGPRKRRYPEHSSPSPRPSPGPSREWS
jgi:hypothetical protein